MIAYRNQIGISCSLCNESPLGHRKHFGVVYNRYDSNHSNRSPLLHESKANGLEDFRKIPNGTAGVEDRMSVLWHHGVWTGKLTPQSLLLLLPQYSAIFHYLSRKGSLAPGADADIVVWDPQATRTISKETHHQNIVIIFEVWK